MDSNGWVMDVKRLLRYAMEQKWFDFLYNFNNIKWMKYEKDKDDGGISNKSSSHRDKSKRAKIWDVISSDSSSSLSASVWLFLVYIEISLNAQEHHHQQNEDRSDDEQEYYQKYLQKMEEFGAASVEAVAEKFIIDNPDEAAKVIKIYDDMKDKSAFHFLTLLVLRYKSANITKDLAPLLHIVDNEYEKTLTKKYIETSTILQQITTDIEQILSVNNNNSNIDKTIEIDKGHYVAEMVACCRRIKIYRAIQDHQSQHMISMKMNMSSEVNQKRENGLNNMETLRDPHYFILAVYNQSRYSSRLMNTTNSSFFLRSTTSAHLLFSYICDNMTSTSSSTSLSNMDKVFTLLSGILAFQGLMAFLIVSGKNNSLVDGKYFDETDARVRLLVEASKLIDTVSNYGNNGSGNDAGSCKRFSIVGANVNGFTPKTPLFHFVWKNVLLMIEMEGFSKDNVKTKHSALFKVLEIIERDDTLYNDFLRDALQKMLDVGSMDDLEFAIVKRFIAVALTETKKRFNKGLYSEFVMMVQFLFDAENTSKCKNIKYTLAPLRQFPERYDNIIVKSHRYGKDIKVDIFNELFEQTTTYFVENSTESVRKALRAIRLLIGLCKVDKDVQEYVRKACNNEKYCIINSLCALAAYQGSSYPFEDDEEFLKFIGLFHMQKNISASYLEYLASQLLCFFKDASIAWKAIQAVAVTLAKYERHFYKTGREGGCPYLLKLILEMSWTKKGKLFGNREKYLLSILFQQTRENIENRFNLLECIAMVDQSIYGNNQFQSPFLCDSMKEDMKNNQFDLRNIVYWILFREENKSLCAVVDLFKGNQNSFLQAIRSQVAKDKLIYQFADHVNKNEKWSSFLDFKCTGYSCKGMNHHRRVAKENLFVGDDGIKYAKNFIGYLRLDIAEKILCQSPDILNSVGLTVLIPQKIESNPSNDDYRSLLLPSFLREESTDRQNEIDHLEFGRMRTILVSCITTGESFAKFIEDTVSESNRYSYRGFLLFLLHENGLMQRKNISNIVIDDRVCKFLLINEEERQWFEALGGNLVHFPVDQIPPLIMNNDTDQHKRLKSLSPPLYYLTCEPREPIGLFYLSILVTALSAQRERNHLWQRIFNVSQTRKNIGAPMFRDFTELPDVDCAYDLEHDSNDVLFEMSEKSLQMSHIGSVAWACNSLSCALKNVRNDSLLKSIRDLCLLVGDQKSSIGMDKSLVDLAGDNEFAWRCQYMHIRAVNFLEILQNNIESSFSSNAQIRSWPRGIPYTFSISVLDRYRQQMRNMQNFPGTFATVEDIINYEQLLAQIIVEVQMNTVRILQTVKDSSISQKLGYVIEAQEFVNNISSSNLVKHKSMDDICNSVGKAMNEYKLIAHECPHILDYILSYSRLKESVEALNQHGLKLYEIYRFCFERLNGKLSIGMKDIRYADCTLLLDVLNNFAIDEAKKGNKHISEKALLYSKEVGYHYDQISKIVDLNTHIGCEKTMRPIGDMLLSGDALGGVPDNEIEFGWIIKVLIDAYKVVNTVAWYIDEDRDILWKWDKHQSLLFDFNKDDNISSLLFELKTVNEIDAMPEFITNHLICLDSSDYEARHLLDSIRDVSRALTINNSVNGMRLNEIRESDICLPFEWVE